MSNLTKEEYQEEQSNMSGNPMIREGGSLRHYRECDFKEASMTHQSDRDLIISTFSELCETMSEDLAFETTCGILNISQEEARLLVVENET